MSRITKLTKSYDEDEEYFDWETPECVNCIRTAYKTYHEGEDCDAEKWICVGNIQYPEDPENIHDILNKIRVCIAKTEDKVTQFEWTPYEANIVSAFISLAISNELYEQQPYHEEGNIVIPPNALLDKKVEYAVEQHVR